jgi:hypothetical protein
MDFFRRFTFLVCAPAFDAEDLEGLRLGQITVAIEKLGFQVVRARRIEDAEIAVRTDAAIGCMVVDWGKKGLEGKTAALINLMRRRGLEMPIVMLVRRKRFEDIPVEVLDYIDGYIFLAEETPEFIATNLVSRLKQYAETLKTPFFGALVDYGEPAINCGPVPAIMAASSTTAARSAGSSSSTSARRCSATTSTIPCSSWATCWSMRAPPSRRSRRPPRSSAPKRPISCSTVPRRRTRSCCPRWWRRATSCCSIATTTRRPITARCSSAAAFRSFSRPTATPTA